MATKEEDDIMSLFSKVKHYEETKIDSVRSVTIISSRNEEVCIHLIPPSFYLDGEESYAGDPNSGPYIALVNNEYKIILDKSDAVLLNEFFIQLEANPITEPKLAKKQLSSVIENTVAVIGKVYFKQLPATLAKDLKKLIHRICEISDSDESYFITDFKQEVEES